MNGFGGFVNYAANYLYELDKVTGILWKMADALGNGQRFGVDVPEENGAFVLNSRVPLSGGDYYRRDGGRIFYKFINDYMGCGAFFLPAEKELYLFRGADGEPVYYILIEGNTLVFGTNPDVLRVYSEHDAHETLNPGEGLVFCENGLRHYALLSILSDNSLRLLDMIMKASM